MDVPEIFTFTEENFSAIGSRLDLFPVAYGVTGSAAFPGAFHYLTLREYNKQGRGTISSISWTAVSWTTSASNP